MDILQQCQKWHENEEYQKIIDALEALAERTPEEDSELARAYNNLAGQSYPEGRDLLRKAIALLKLHEESFSGDHLWNFRMGYAYYYLDQEGRALPYFRAALKARPDDGDTKEFIAWCEDGISLPRFSQNFRERTESAWESFAGQEARLRRILDTDGKNERAAELVEQCQAILNQAFDEIAFEIGFNGDKYELILSPEGDEAKLFELVYFQKHAPARVKEHWNILVGRQPNPDIALRTDDGREIGGRDVRVWVEQRGENSFALFAYSEKLPQRQSEDDGRPEWMLCTLTDQILGEISHMRCIDEFNLLDAPREEPSFTLSELPDRLKELGTKLSADPEDYLASYTGYQMEPDQDPDADWRLDIIAGSTCCAPLVNGYLNADNYFADELEADGAAAGFFCYPLDTLREKEGSRKIFDFRDKLEKTLTSDDGEEILTVTGGATGIYCGYVDFIAWDIGAALDKAEAFFGKTDIPWASFHTFRREAGTVALKQPEEGNGGSPDGTAPLDEEPGVPEIYDEADVDAVQAHIGKYFGAFEHVYHELVSPDIHVDICVVPPDGERNYYTLATMGMGAHRMNVPEELAEYKLERAELVIALPRYWKLDQESLQDERWYWPVRLLKDLARLPIHTDSWLGQGHSFSNSEQEFFAEGTKLCASVLTAPQKVGNGAEVCTLPDGEEVNFYQVIPLYEDELEYKLSHDADALLDRIEAEGISFVVNPVRRDAISGNAF